MQTRTPIRLTPNLFAIAFGTAGVVQCWATTAAAGMVPRWTADAGWLLVAALWLAVFLIYSRYVVRSGRLRTELADPVYGPFVPLMSIVLMPLGVALAQHWRLGGVIVFSAGLVVTVLLGGWLSGQWIIEEQDLRQWNPGYFLPTVAGGLIASIGCSGLGWHRLALAMFGYGGICWMVLGSIVLQRLFTQPALPLPLRASMAIEMAPPAVAGIAWFLINGGRADGVALGLAGYGTLMALVQVRLIPVYREIPFSLGWWAFAFSYAATFALGLRWLEVLDVPHRTAWSWVLLAVVTAGLVLLYERSIRALARGRFMPRPPAPAPIAPAAAQVTASIS